MTDLAAAPVVWLTVLRPDGSPHTTPVWFVVDADDHIWIASSTVNRKVQHLAHDGRASLAVDGSGRDPVVLEGTAAIHPDPALHPAVVDALAAKYPGWDPLDEAQDGPRVLVEITITRHLMGPTPLT